MTSDEVKILDLEHRLKALELAGDFLAHQLTFPQHERELAAWWKLRRHSDCYVCCPRGNDLSDNVGTDLRGNTDADETIRGYQEYEKLWGGIIFK